MEATEPIIFKNACRLCLSLWSFEELAEDEQDDRTSRY